MKIFCMILLLGLLSLGACKKEKSPQKNVNMTLSGDWYMTNYHTLLPQATIINYGDVRWSFDDAAQTITVQDNINYFYPSGTYSYSTTATHIYINFNGNIQTFDYSFSNRRMVLSDNPEADGPLLKFIR